MCLLRCLSLGSVLSGYDPDTGIDVKFHNQLHFKSSMYVPGHDEILCKGSDIIPLDVDSNAFQIFAKGERN